MSPTGLLAVYGRGSAVQVWDVERRALVRVIATGLSESNDARWTAAGDRLVVSGPLTGDVLNDGAPVTRVFDLAGHQL